MAQATCLHCNELYNVRPYMISTTKYCSRRCMALNVRIRLSTPCEVCGTVFEHISSRANKAKYCSRKCYYKAQHLKGTVIHNCVHCGKEFKSAPSHKRKYCSRTCISKSSKDTWNPAFSTIRKAMAARGLINACARCGLSEPKEILGVHHKDRNRKNNNLENLEVVCPNCHSKEHLKHLPQSG